MPIVSIPFWSRKLFICLPFRKFFCHVHRVCWPKSTVFKRTSARTRIHLLRPNSYTVPVKSINSQNCKFVITNLMYKHECLSEQTKKINNTFIIPPRYCMCCDRFFLLSCLPFFDWKKIAFNKQQVTNWKLYFNWNSFTKFMKSKCNCMPDFCFPFRCLLARFVHRSQ